jgi:hypothetical protein
LVVIAGGWRQGDGYRVGFGEVEGTIVAAGSRSCGEISSTSLRAPAKQFSDLVRSWIASSLTLLAMTMVAI